MQGTKLAVFFNCLCVALASRRIKVIVHTKPPQQSEFQCRTTSNQHYSIPRSTYIDILAYNSEPCACWFKTSTPRSTINTRVLHQGRYECFRDFKLYRKHVEHQKCNEDDRDYPGAMVIGSRLITTITNRGVLVMENRSDIGVVNSSISFQVPKGKGKSLSSLRLQASSTMDIMCGIKLYRSGSSHGTDIISIAPATTVANMSQGTARINKAQPTLPTVYTTKPTPNKASKHKRTTAQTVIRSTPSDRSNNMEEFDGSQHTFDHHWQNASDTLWNDTAGALMTWDRPFGVIFGVMAPVMIGTLCAGAGLVVLTLIIIFIINKKRSSKKDKLHSGDGVTYQGVVNTDANENNKDTTQHNNSEQQRDNNLQSVPAHLNSDPYQFRPIEACRTECAPDHAVDIQRPMGVYPEDASGESAVPVLEGDIDESIASILNDVFTEYHTHQSNMPPKFPTHIVESMTESCE